MGDSFFANNFKNLFKNLGKSQVFTDVADDDDLPQGSDSSSNFFSNNFKNLFKNVGKATAFDENAPKNNTFSDDNPASSSSSSSWGFGFPGFPGAPNFPKSPDITFEKMYRFWDIPQVSADMPGLEIFDFDNPVPFNLITFPFLFIWYIFYFSIYGIGSVGSLLYSGMGSILTTPNILIIFFFIVLIIIFSTLYGLNIINITTFICLIIFFILSLLMYFYNPLQEKYDVYSTDAEETKKKLFDYFTTDNLVKLMQLILYPSMLILAILYPLVVILTMSFQNKDAINALYAFTIILSLFLTIPFIVLFFIPLSKLDPNLQKFFEKTINKTTGGAGSGSFDSTYSDNDETPTPKLYGVIFFICFQLFFTILFFGMTGKYGFLSFTIILFLLYISFYYWFPLIQSFINSSIPDQVWQYFFLAVLLIAIIAAFSYVPFSVFSQHPKLSLFSLLSFCSLLFAAVYKKSTPFPTWLHFIILIILIPLIYIFNYFFTNFKSTTYKSIIMLSLFLYAFCFLKSISQFEFFKNPVFLYSLFLLAIFIASILLFYIIPQPYNLILLFLFLCVIIGYVFNSFKKQYSNESNPKIHLFFSILSFIPCLIYDFFKPIFGGGFYLLKNMSLNSILLIIEIIILLIIGLNLQKSNKPFFTFSNSFGGTQLTNQIIDLSQQTILSNYLLLNNTESQLYHNCISFWFYIDSNTEKTDDFISIFNYNSGNPNIGYIPKQNKLVVLLGDDQLLFSKSGVLLQKWNHVVLNFDRGDLDIFLNNHLEKFLTGIIPIYTLDNITAGSTDGISGKIANIIFFKDAINIYKINSLYKNKPK